MIKARYTHWSDEDKAAIKAEFGSQWVLFKIFGWLAFLSFVGMWSSTVFLIWTTGYFWKVFFTGLVSTYFFNSCRDAYRKGFKLFLKRSKDTGE